MSTGPETLLDRIRAATADEYHIDREIGRGGMASVFLGRDLALDRRVAIKVMLPDLVDVEGVHDRFVEESLLSEQNVLPLYPDTTDSSTAACGLRSE